MPYRVTHDREQGGWFVETIPNGRRLSKKPFKTRKEAEAQKKAVEINEFGGSKTKSLQAQFREVQWKLEGLRDYLSLLQAIAADRDRL